MLETGVLHDYRRGRFATWLYLRTHRRRAGERLARAEFQKRFGHTPWAVRQLNSVTWAAGPLREGET